MTFSTWPQAGTSLPWRWSAPRPATLGKSNRSRPGCSSRPTHRSRSVSFGACDLRSGQHRLQRPLSGHRAYSRLLACPMRPSPLRRPMSRPGRVRPEPRSSASRRETLLQNGQEEFVDAFRVEEFRQVRRVYLGHRRPLRERVQHVLDRVVASGLRKER